MTTGWRQTICFTLQALLLGEETIQYSDYSIILLQYINCQDLKNLSLTHQRQADFQDGKKKLKIVMDFVSGFTLLKLILI
jgi:hypothetical protein